MPHRNSTTKNPPLSTVTPLRRSPRLLTKELAPPEYPKTPDPKSEKTLKRFPELKSGSDRSVCLRRSPRFSVKKITTTDELEVEKSSGKANQKGLLNYGKNGMGIDGIAETVARSEKRVTRGSVRGINGSKQIESVKKINEEELPVVGSAKQSFHLCKGIGAQFEKRVTRSSSPGINENKEIVSSEKIAEEGSPVVENANVGVKASKQSRCKLEKRTTRSSEAKKGKGGVARSSCNGIVSGEGFVAVERAKVVDNSCEEFGCKLEKGAIGRYGASLELVGGEGKKDGDLDTGVKEIGIKRKRNQSEEGHVVDRGWTKDQEMALQRAYYSAKPTPLFWKKVAKLVPGKSAKDCFNKIHSDHLTPPQPRTRLRSRKTKSPSFSLPSCTLLKPEEPITKKPRVRKQSRHLAQKTLRQMLQKHYHVDQNYEADLFSVLESTMSPSNQNLQKALKHSTPGGEQNDSGHLKKCRDKSSSAHHAKQMSRLSGSYGETLTHSTPGGEQNDSGHLKKCRDKSSSAHHAKHMSRFSGSYGATLMSPPVLKPVKNKALHEKYIDQLHSREAKRRAAKGIRGKENRKESCTSIHKTDFIKAAKNALVFDAKDVIHQIHQEKVKVSGTGNFSDFDDDFVESDYEVESET